MSQSLNARISIDTHRVIGTISPLLFSGFAEHMGRCIYEGVYDPASPYADDNGLRTDVMDALRELNYRSMRYPGGNFLSGYYWEDGIGPKEQRPRRRDLAWQAIESNQFGTDEFMHFCKEIGTAPMMAVNLGTGTIQDAANLIEYCNAPVGTQYADLRAKYGNHAPYDVKYWCLGNEMDGSWQIGHLDATAYGKKAREAAKMMRWHDPEIELILCGSSNNRMATYPEWDRIALELCWDQVEYHSMHYYANNYEDDTASFLAISAELEDFVDTLSGVLRYVKAKNRSKHDVYLSWDEWNISYKAKQQAKTAPKWVEARHIAEEIYNLEDALVIAQWLSVFLRKADVVKIACIAQIVNILAPILTTTDAMLKQSIFYPFMLFSRMANGNSLDVIINSPTYETARYGAMPMLDVSASHNPETNTHAIFLVNRSQTESVPVEVNWQDVTPTSVTSTYQLSGTDPKAANSFGNPNQIVAIPIASPEIKASQITMILPPLSFTAIELKL